MSPSNCTSASKTRSDVSQCQERFAFDDRRGGAFRALPHSHGRGPWGNGRLAKQVTACALSSNAVQDDLSNRSGAVGAEDADSFGRAEAMEESGEGNGAPTPQPRKKKRKNVAEIRAMALGETPPKSKPTKLKKKTGKPKSAGPSKTGQSGGLKKVSRSTQGLITPAALESLEELSVEALLKKGEKLLGMGSAVRAGLFFGECVRRGAEKGDAVTALLGLAEALFAQSSYGETVRPAPTWAPIVLGPEFPSGC